MVPLNYSVECEFDQFSPSHISLIKAESSVFSQGFPLRDIPLRAQYHRDN